MGDRKRLFRIKSKKNGIGHIKPTLHSHTHTLPSRTSQRSNQNLAKSVSVQPHNQNDRQTNGKKNTEAIASPIRKQGFRVS